MSNGKQMSGGPASAGRATRSAAEASRTIVSGRIRRVISPSARLDAAVSTSVNHHGHLETRFTRNAQHLGAKTAVTVNTVSSVLTVVHGGWALRLQSHLSDEPAAHPFAR